MGRRHSYSTLSAWETSCSCPQNEFPLAEKEKINNSANFIILNILVS